MAAPATQVQPKTVGSHAQSKAASGVGAAATAGGTNTPPPVTPAAANPAARATLPRPTAPAAFSPAPFRGALSPPRERHVRESVAAEDSGRVPTSAAPAPNGSRAASTSRHKAFPPR